MGKAYDKLMKLWVSALMAADELIAAARAEGGVRGKGAAYEDIVDRYAIKSGLFDRESVERSRVFRHPDDRAGTEDTDEREVSEAERDSR